MRPDQERVSGLIASTIIKLCEKGLDFSTNVKIEGVIGITIDAEQSFVVHVNRTLSLNDCGAQNSTAPNNKISSSNIQEASSSENRDGAISVGSTISSHSLNAADVLYQTPINTVNSNVKEEKETVDAYGHHVIQPQASVSNDGSFFWPKSMDFDFVNINSEDNSYNSTKIEVPDNSNDHTNSTLNFNDEDTIDFKDRDFEIKTELAQDVKFNMVQAETDQAFYGQDKLQWQQQNQGFSQQRMIFSQNQSRARTPGKVSTVAVYQNPAGSPTANRGRMTSPAMQKVNPFVRNQLQQPSPMMNAAGPFNQFQPQSFRDSSVAPSSSGMALACMQQPRMRMGAPQRPTMQPRPRIPQQGYASDASPRMSNPGQRPRALSTGVRMPARGGRRGGGMQASGGRGGRNAANQVVECPSGDGFSFNKQLTVLSRYSCNLCGKVYKNQRSVLHHQSQVHGRPKVKRRKKTDSYEEEEEYGEEVGEEGYYEEGYGEEMW